MSKTTRIIHLIHLLHTRHYVSLKTIMDDCGIPERTAYRYLNTISDANIPVFYDKSMSAYTLNKQVTTFVPDISFGDSLLLTLALKVLQAIVNPSYGNTIGQMLTKIQVRQQWKMETAFGPATDRLISSIESIDLSEQLSSALIHAAVCCNRSVRIESHIGSDDHCTQEFTSPGLRFRDTWQLSGIEMMGEELPRIDSIQEVKVF